MPIPDDEQFETYLRRFQPLASSLPVETLARSRLKLSLTVDSLAVAAIVLVVVGFSLHIWPARRNAGERLTTTAAVERPQSLEPLTLRGANALLATAPSFTAAIRGISLRSTTVAPPAGKSSALAVLSKEKTRL